MSTPDLRALLAFWTPVLRVQDWQVEALYDPKLEALGVCYADHVYRRARIVVQPAQDDVEASLVHELLHLHFAPFETEGGSPERTEEERAVESLMRGYIDLRRSGTPADQVQRRARTAFEARLRAIPGHRGSGKGKTRMDMTMLLAALEAALAAEDPAAAKEAALAQIAAMKKAMGDAGGEMAPPSAAPPMGEEPKPPMAKPPPGEEKKPPMADYKDDKAPMRAIDARLRALETKLTEDAKARAAETERKRAELYTANEARIPEAGRAFAKALDLDKLDAYLRTLPAVAPVERSSVATRGGKGSAADAERLGRLRTAMGIPDPSVRLPGRDERGRRVWSVNEPSKLRAALAKTVEGGAS